MSHRRRVPKPDPASRPIPTFLDGVLRALFSWETVVSTACHMLAYYAVAGEFGNTAGLAAIIPVNLGVRVILSLDRSTGRR